MVELLVILLVISVALPQLGVVMPAPLGKVLGVMIFVILFFWLLGYLSIHF